MSNDEYWLKKYPSLIYDMTEWDRKALAKIDPSDLDEKTIRYKMKSLGEWIEHVENGTPWKSIIGREYREKLSHWKLIKFVLNIVLQIGAFLLISWGFSVLPCSSVPRLEQITFSLLHVCLGIVLCVISSFCWGLVTTEWRAEKLSSKWLAKAVGLTKPLKYRSRRVIKRDLKSIRRVRLVYAYMPVCFFSALFASVSVSESWLTSIIHGPLLELFGIYPPELPQPNCGEGLTVVLCLLILGNFAVSFFLASKEE